MPNSRHCTAKHDNVLRAQNSPNFIRDWINFWKCSVNIRNWFWRHLTYNVLTPCIFKLCSVYLAWSLTSCMLSPVCLVWALRKHPLCPVYLVKAWTSDTLCLDLPHASLNTASGRLHYVFWAVMLWWCFENSKAFSQHFLLYLLWTQQNLQAVVMLYLVPSMNVS